MSPLRVLCVATVLAQGPSGVARHAEEVFPRAAQRLARAGGTLVLLEGRRRVGGGLAALERIAGGAPAGPPALRAPLERRAIRRALREARAAGRPFDVVHQGHLPFATGAVRALGAAPVWLVHDLRRAGRALGAALVVRTARAATRVVTVSRAVADELALLTLDTHAPVRTIAHGADHLPRIERATADGTFVLGVGHLVARKDWQTAIRAWASADDLPPLLVAGGAHGRAGRKEARRLAGLARRLEGRVRFLGAVPDAELAALYARAAAVVSCSLLEGFSLTAVEAARAGAPLVVSDIAAHRETAPDAAKFAAGDAGALVARLREVLAHPTAPAPPTRTWDEAADDLVTTWEEAAAARDYW